MTIAGSGQTNAEITRLIDFQNFELIVIKSLALLAVLFYTSQVYMNDIKCRVRLISLLLSTFTARKKACGVEGAPC